MKRFVSVKSLADRYDVSPSTIWRWTSAGQLPKPVRLSKQCTRWEIDKVEERERELRDSE